ncbi:hypothetical protein KXD40_002848 [Peronospora effusa]|nr:hypothetical protein KXD40_002848 [Peronospora effusa]
MTNISGDTMTNTSDAETVFEDDSPLSPCLWTLNQVVENQHQRTHHELQLSPASQLNVLSHISELADAPSRQTGIVSRLGTQQTQRSNVWGAAIQTAKRKETSRPVRSSRARSKRHKNDQKPMQSQADRLATDMLDWETCSEGDLFTFEDKMEEDQWIYEEIDDSELEDEAS